MADGPLKDNSINIINNPGQEWRSGFREGIWRKYSLWHFPLHIENAKETMPTVGEMLQPLALNVDAIPIHNIYRPDEVVSIMEPVVNIANLAGEPPRVRGDETYSLVRPNVYRIWYPDNTIEKFWATPENGREAAMLKKIYGGLAHAGKLITDPHEILQFVQHVTHAVGTTPFLTELGREMGLLQAALEVAGRLRGRTDTLDAHDRKFFPLNVEILEGVRADPTGLHKRLNDEIYSSKIEGKFPASTILQARGIDRGYSERLTQVMV